MDCLKWEMFLEVWTLANKFKPWFMDVWSYWFQCRASDGFIGFIL